ncbi:MAG TPA: L-ribulose-5-phosphate 4-epimerase AraD [Planctomycetota bacterium]|nr:L-ribulose-5-phosphate 4-epimerase AraD [Planctomycetota bacterium]
MTAPSDALGDLRQTVFDANLELVRQGLILSTWGNASGVDRAAGVMLIKPSGVAYERLRPQDLVAVDLASGRVIADANGATLKPSSDAATHLELYRAWPAIGGIVHTHSEYATAVAQACRPIVAMGTTQADYFHGDVPCTRPLTAAEIDGGYEVETGRVIVACFARGGLDPAAIPGVLVAQHAPFAWGETPAAAAFHAVVIERLARMQVHALTVNPAAGRAPQHLLDKHYRRKHGPNAYYGQGPKA